MQAMLAIIKQSTMRSACTGGLECTGPSVSMCEAARSASKASMCSSKLQASLYLYQFQKKSWDYITADCMANLPKAKKGVNAILVAVDRLTIKTHVVPCSNELTAHDLVQLCLDNSWKHHGMQLHITIDRGLNFRNMFIAALSELVGTMHCKYTAHHLQSASQTERNEQGAGRHAAPYVNPRQHKWDDFLSCAEFAVNKGQAPETV